MAMDLCRSYSLNLDKPEIHNGIVPVNPFRHSSNLVNLVRLESEDGKVETSPLNGNRKSSVHASWLAGGQIATTWYVGVPNETSNPISVGTEPVNLFPPSLNHPEPTG